MSQEYFQISLPNTTPEQGPIDCLSFIICYPFLNYFHAPQSFKVFLQYQGNAQTLLLIWFKWFGPFNSWSAPKGLLYSEELVHADPRPVLPLKGWGINEDEKCPERLLENQSTNLTFLPGLSEASRFTNTSQDWTTALSKLAPSPGSQTPGEGNELRALTFFITEKD